MIRVKKLVKNAGVYLTFIKKIVKAAAVIPHDCIIREKSRAIAGFMPKARVITGKATAPPPSEVIPEMHKSLFC